MKASWSMHIAESSKAKFVTQKLQPCTESKSENYDQKTVELT